MSIKKRDTVGSFEEIHDESKPTVSSSDRKSYNQKQIREMEFMIESLENENDDLRRHPNAAPSDDADVRLYEMTRELMQVHRRNRKLTSTLQEAKEKLEHLKEKVEQLSAPPHNYGVFLGVNADDTIDIDLGGKRWKVKSDPDIDISRLKKGQEVIVNGVLNVVGALYFD